MSYINRMFVKPMNTFVRTILLVVPVVCIVLFLTLTAFARNTYYINDGGRVFVHTTFATDPAEILNEAGVELDNGDTYITQTGTGASEITVQRRQNITVIYHDLELQVYSYGETVEKLLQRLELECISSDVISLPLSAQTYNGMVLTISPTAWVQDSYVQTVPFETIYCQDPTLPEGEEVVLIQGVDGQLSCTDNVCYVDGVEMGRTELVRDMIKQPVSALVAVGTMVEQPGQSGTITTATGETLRYIRAVTMRASGYSKYDEGCDDYTATGMLARYGVVAVDPSVIPLGSRLYIVTNDGFIVYGHAVAGDTGGAIKGDRIDLCFDTVQQALMFGRRECTVYILSEGK